MNKMGMNKMEMNKINADVKIAKDKAYLTYQNAIKLQLLLELENKLDYALKLQ